ncbi:DUF2085 domain-containing protein [Polyangium sp. 15x6]|uniref:DUF2085 domain-containing protein n=1 Tax=Polyangium sp. 15x6 TaxID=3042687 RepID=UPI00249BDC11|nr:DUF2085 domain-containing protein [Polyangium sp. 15x6]MDI3289194.1 DUF2085 domain-containing protein [Polyangium sp. 15x6]
MIREKTTSFEKEIGENAMRRWSIPRAAFVVVGLSPWLLSPARAWLPLGEAGALLDAAFGAICHRIPERTLTLAGVAMPVCSRCAGIFAGAAAGALVARPALSPGAWRLWMIAASLAMLADVVARGAGLYPGCHAARLATGFSFGYTIAAACVDMLRRERGQPSA